MKHISVVEYLYKCDETWSFFKLWNYDPKSLEEIDTWLKTMINENDYKVVGWYHGCAYDLGVALRNETDIFYFKLVYEGHGAKQEEHFYEYAKKYYSELTEEDLYEGDEEDEY